jgi:hypothetical protein
VSEDWEVDAVDDLIVVVGLVVVEADPRREAVRTQLHVLAPMVVITTDGAVDAALGGNVPLAVRTRHRHLLATRAKITARVTGRTCYLHRRSYI